MCVTSTNSTTPRFVSRRNNEKRQKGFSLIELLIVVAIILIIAAIAIPNLLRSRMAANEASAVGSIRTMNTAATFSYNSTYGNTFPCRWPRSVQRVPRPSSCDNAAFLDSEVLPAADQKSGYTFKVLAGNGLWRETAGLQHCGLPTAPVMAWWQPRLRSARLVSAVSVRTLPV